MTLIQALSTVSILLLVGCAAPVSRYALQEVAQSPLVYEVESEKESKIKLQSYETGLVVINGVTYQLPGQCAGQRLFDGQVENRNYSGSSEERYYQTKWEQRKYEGLIESRDIAGKIESRIYAGSEEARLHGYDTESRNYAHDAESRRYEVSSEQRIYGAQLSRVYCVSDKLTGEVSIVDENWSKIDEAQVKFN